MRFGPRGGELAIFLAFGVGAAMLWGRLVADPPIARLAVMLAICMVGAKAIASLARIARYRVLVRWAGAALVVATIGAGAVALGVPVRLLWLPNWAELLENLRFGVAGIEEAELPYGGGDAWTRLSLLLGAPALVALAAGLAFFPQPRPEWGRALALAPLVASWGTPATLDSPPAELAWGFVLLALCGAWLWLPELARRDLIPAAAALGLAGVVAVPAAAALDRERPWWDYQSWDWFGRARATTYDWNHSYGPLDWPQEGRTLLEIQSPRALYWRTTVLDRFDGFSWQRAQTGDLLASPEVAARSALPRGDLADQNPRWLASAQIDVRQVRSDVVIGAGVTRDVDGMEDPITSPDGTMLHRGDGLEPGDEYSINVYAPRPREARLRRASRTYPERFRAATLVALPGWSGFSPEVRPVSVPGGDGVTPLDSGDLAPGRAISFGVWGRPEPAATRAALASEYESVYRLALRLTDPATNAYDAVRRVETHLRTTYTYRANVPEHTYPLTGFLFDDRAGYCQHFSGAMALMLRMVGIPARVVAGFAPGRYDADRDVYEVRDLDAHSWVEVYFRGVGWITFDPTPGAAPAASQALGNAGPVLLSESGRLSDPGSSEADEPQGGLRRSGAAAESAGGDGPWAALGVAALVMLGMAAGGAAAVSWRRRRRLLTDRAADLRVTELVAALTRLGWTLGPTVTLLEIERRFGRSGRRTIARYAAALRATRYGGPGVAPPEPALRRKLRRALATGGGLSGWLRAMWAVPPGGPALR